ncbi:hypothetical protein ASPZODRAFT_20504 [Penicilliopsis zonata CBS 506.65]|uniref:Uncharacterized protein n=1 Tax=Penicilliopsis zonata CBS 506.65 TaxID=1073090 RepID=A0A1L9S5E4_9EURO|nr:hypothetical protein ASPZODRAFT_20504 [Penicilliopsis zonata CBS 506.65]OJJ42386.1 hypothetical protein ASPZODRAFT_20504 [Penicilliopsis zonata CBS 506.65]
MVTLILDSMLAHDPYTLPLATVYKATENSHPAALSMMTAWRTITEAGPPSLLALDSRQGTAYFALDVSEGNAARETILRGRIKVVDMDEMESEGVMPLLAPFGATGDTLEVLQFYDDALQACRSMFT